jgi:uncharacterized protein (UPF0147 family)
MDTVSRTWIWTVITPSPVNFIPPDPVNLQNTTGNFQVNHTWQPGAGNATNSYNVNINGLWTNGTTSTFENTTSTTHGWVNITVYAYNFSGTGSLSTAGISQDTQVPNNVPVIAQIGPRTVNEGDMLSFNVSAADPDGDSLTNGTNATKGTLNPATGNFTWQTTFGDSGTYVWNFNSTDSYGGIASETITVTVNNVPLSITSSLPVSDPATIQGTAQDFNITLSRTANVTWYINGTPVQADPGVTLASYTNSTAEAGIYNVTSTASDSMDTVSRTWIWTVNTPSPVNFIPPDPANLQNTTGNFQVNHTWQAGAGNATNSYNVNINGLWTNGTTSTFENTTSTPHGWVNITVYAYNFSGTGSLSTGSISQDTQVPNNVPVIAQIGPRVLNEGDLLSFDVSATDPDGDALTNGTNATKGTLNPATGNFTWQTTFGNSGAYVWYFNSTDSYGGIASETITVTVNNTPLSFNSSLPETDPATIQGTAQDFNITLNRTANVTWYINGSEVQINLSVMSANYTNSTAGAGLYNVTAIAIDLYDSVSRMWNWTVN